MTDTFTWKVITESSGSGTLTVNKTQFDDGYSQTLPRGLNPDVQTWSVVYADYEENAQPVIDFIRAHEGRPFFWKPPLSAEGYYQCINYKIVPNSGNHYSIQMEFVQSYAPVDEPGGGT